MRQIAPLHPEAQRVQEIIAELERGVVPPVPLPEMRALMRKRTARLAADPPPVACIVNRTVEESGCSVPVRIYYPGDPSDGKAAPAYIYAHGGGFVVGDLDMVETMCRTVCRDANIVVVSVDYRLAPEHRFPKGLDDMIAVTRFIAREGRTLGIDSGRLAIGGDSAGGNLAAAACQALHGRDGIAIRYQVLVYPVTDLTCSEPSYMDLGPGYPLTAERMRNYINLYLDDPAREVHDPRASPLLAKTLEGQPPALVILAGLDPLVDEGRAYARRLKESGGEAEVVEVPDHPHGFLGWSREAEASRKALKLIGTRLRERL
ncbi:MAG TPA: alpha/beta hydrolase [Hyphomicrobiaceae bacterium]|nr:alpha/beta hydrolase [Hyphomicrobiaceae bacterium]